MPPTSRLHEQTFNTGLARAIRQRNPRWKRSRRNIVSEEPLQAFRDGRGRPDILIDDPLSPPVIIETSFQMADSVKDASARIGRIAKSSGLKIRAAIAVIIPISVRRFQSVDEVITWLQQGHYFGYILVQGDDPSSSTRWPTAGQIDGTLDDLVAVLPTICQSQQVISRLAEKVSVLIQQAAELIHRDTHPEVHAEIAESVKQRMPWHGLTTSSVLWLNALLAQNRLRKARRVGIPSFDNCRSPATDGLVPRKFLAAWRTALDVNFASIFVPAIASLKVASAESMWGTAMALERLCEAVQDIEHSRLGSYIDIGAELFPKLSDDQKTAAAFYTRPPIAEFLACLTVRDDAGLGRSCKWGSRTLGKHIRIADTACGTGTLVRAGYRQIRNFHEKNGGNTKTLHKHFMEHGVVATDISAIAAHLTATSLSAMEPSVTYGDVQIGCVPVGNPDQTGSLEFLKKSEVGDLFQSSFVGSQGKKTTNSLASASLQDGTLSYFLANPPYSRTRGGQSLFDVSGLSELERNASQHRARNLGRKTFANLKAGLATYFVAMADKKLKTKGRMGFVLPLSAASQDSYRKMRKAIETSYSHVMAITVAGGTVGEESLSSDTGMSEMLLVCQKGMARNLKSSPIYCINLQSGLRELAHAREVARAIFRSIDRYSSSKSGEILVGQQSIGRWIRRNRTGQGDPWSELGTLQHELALAASELIEGRYVDLSTGKATSLEVPFVQLGDLFDVGPTHDLIGHLVGSTSVRGAFEFHEIDRHVSSYRDLSLWAADSKTQTQLVVSPTHRGMDPSMPDFDQQERMRAKMGRLFYARNLRWTSQALVAAVTNEFVFGGRAWTALLHDDVRVIKAFALWANSTFGMIVHWTQGGRQQLGRSLIQVGAIHRIPVPNFAVCSDSVLNDASKSFDALSSATLRPACQAHVDETRVKIDRVVVEIIGLKKNVVAQSINPLFTSQEFVNKGVSTLTVAFCREPHVHGDNKTALRLLQSV